MMSKLSVRSDMTSIKALHPDVRAKIAAGEVIARPVSVVKELIENALDAGARRIDLDIRDGGKQLIAVNDDGSGMAADDVLQAVERYATSKIVTIEDISNIRTYGFRGEALASIAQVSHLELETSDGTGGTRLEISGGEITGVHEFHRPRGTRIRVTDLFYNLPARKKFLKSGQWERRLIVSLVKSYAWIHPSVAFHVREGERQVLAMAGMSRGIDRVRAHEPRHLVGSLVSIDEEVSDMRFVGFFSRPDLQDMHHFNHLYVNGRPVKYPRLYRAVLDAYEHPKQAPVFLLDIQVDPAKVDVNIHPTKNEVKLQDERYVVDVIRQMVRKYVFQRYEPTGQGTEEHVSGAAVSPREHQFVQDGFMPYESSSRKEPSAIRDGQEFWQTHDMYILAQTKSGLIIVDQHVAHERIIYESIMKGRSSSQRLLFPITLELTPEEHRVFKRTKRLLKEFGIDFKEFSARTVVIDSVPSDAAIGRDDLEGLFRELDALGNLIQEKSEIAKVVACRSSIKAGQKLSVVEMQSLIDRLFACDNPYTCPHGRPIIIKLTLDELAAKFGRV
jgi:DNA mismatch repair protein MutL